MSVDDQVDWISKVQDQTKGVRDPLISKVDNKYIVIVKNRLTPDWSKMSFEFKADSIARFDMSSTAPVNQQTSPSKLTSKQIVAEVNKYMAALSKGDIFSGTVLIASNNVILFTKAYGVADKNFNVPIKIDTRLNLASLSKMFTSVAAIQLVEKDKLSLEDPISKFISGILPGGLSDKIKVKHLLTNTSGLGDVFTEEWYNMSRDKFKTIDDYMVFVTDTILPFEPGTNRRYSNKGFMLLGKIIEKASGVSYFEYVKNNIFQKAGMANTDNYDMEMVNTNVAVGYNKVYTDSGIIFKNNIFKHVVRGMPPGGGFSTVNDLYKFSRAFLGGNLVSPSSVTLMTTPKPELNSPNYGFGFGLIPEDGVIAHSGGAEGVGAHIEMNTIKGFTFIVLSNYGGAMQNVALKLRWLVSRYE